VVSTKIPFYINILYSCIFAWVSEEGKLGSIRPLTVDQELLHSSFKGVYPQRDREVLGDPQQNSGVQIQEEPSSD
jgi:hypothetical protein